MSCRVVKFMNSVSPGFVDFVSHVFLFQCIILLCALTGEYCRNCTDDDGDEVQTSITQKEVCFIFSSRNVSSTNKQTSHS